MRKNVVRLSYFLRSVLSVSASRGANVIGECRKCRTERYRSLQRHVLRILRNYKRRALFKAYSHYRQNHLLPMQGYVLETPVINCEGLSICIGGIPYLNYIIVVGAITGRLMAGLYYSFMIAFVIKRIY